MRGIAFARANSNIRLRIYASAVDDLQPYIAISVKTPNVSMSAEWRVNYKNVINLCPYFAIFS